MPNDLTPDEEAAILGAIRCGNVRCEMCGKMYLQHPDYLPSAKTNDGTPWLKIVCDRTELVKL